MHSDKEVTKKKERRKGSGSLTTLPRRAYPRVTFPQWLKERMTPSHYGSSRHLEQEETARFASSSVGCFHGSGQIGVTPNMISTMDKFS